MVAFSGIGFSACAKSACVSCCICDLFIHTHYSKSRYNLLGFITLSNKNTTFFLAKNKKVAVRYLRNSYCLLCLYSNQIRWLGIYLYSLGSEWRNL